MANRAACANLGLPEETELAGRPTLEILPERPLLPVLATRKPDFDREVWLRGRKVVVNRLPGGQNNEVIGVVTSFRPSDELFFFQAEDGIRDGRVTGVQTCALPI